MFRPPAFLTLTAPLVITALLPHKRIESMFYCQFLFHAYTSGFSLANGNLRKEVTMTDAEKVFEKNQVFLTTGAVLFTSCIGSSPTYFLIRHKPKTPSVQFLLKRIIPGPLTAFLCVFNIFVMRAGEYVNGIEVMDSKGQVIGISQRAGEKAVKETALSRAAMISAAMLLPDFGLHFLKRASIVLHNPVILASLRSGLIILALGAMIPISFSWMPQIGKIKRSKLEPEITSCSEETEFFYHRGV